MQCCPLKAAPNRVQPALEPNDVAAMAIGGALEAREETHARLIEAAIQP